MLINGLYNIIGLERHIVGGDKGIVGGDKGSVGGGKGGRADKEADSNEKVLGNKGDGSGVVREQGENQEKNYCEKQEKNCRRNQGQKYGQYCGRGLQESEGELRESEREVRGSVQGLQECGQGVQGERLGVQGERGLIQGERRVEIRLCGEGEIYKAHFPNKPITPGACLVQIAEELIGAPITQIAHLKFLQTVPPDTELVFSFVPKQENQYTITITGSGGKVDVEEREKDVNKGSEEIVGNSEEIVGKSENINRENSEIDKNNIDVDKKDLDSIVTYARFVATYMRTDTDL